MSNVKRTEQIVKHKVGLINLACELNNISKACKMMGPSRDTFYRYRNAYEAGGVEQLIDKSKRGPNYKNRVSEEIEDQVKKMAIDQPGWGHARVSNELRRKEILVSPTGVRGIWLRNNLANMKQRLKALEEKVAKEGYVLTEAQLQIVEKQKDEAMAHGEIETEHPGYLGSQDTFFVGTMKGVGRIYQQTFVDTFSKIALCKLYKSKTAITAADMLNDKVLPFFDKEKVPMLRILTDRGTEYCGRLDAHEYQLFLAISDIDHTRTKARSPQTNGIVERFHRTILQDFYQVALRKKIYSSMEELQIDLDAWVDLYNNDRTHQGKHCLGRTPMQTFIDGKKIVAEKTINKNIKSEERPVKDNLFLPSLEGRQKEIFCNGKDRNKLENMGGSMIEGI